MNRDELNAEIEHTGLLERLATAKAAAAADRNPDTLAEVHAAGAALGAFRAHARSNRVPNDAAPGDGVAAPDPVQVTTEGG